MENNEMLRAMNRTNRAFWEELNARFRHRMDDPGLYEMTFSLAESEINRVPVSGWNSSEHWSNIAVKSRAITLREQGRRGGNAPKRDTLHEIIKDVVGNNPNTTVQDLQRILTRDAYPGLINDVEEESIWYTQPVASGEEKLKKASIRGLKDRLCRAKKNLKSR